MHRDDPYREYWRPSEHTEPSSRLPYWPDFVGSDGNPLLVRPFGPADWERLLEMYHDFAPNHRAQGLPPVDGTRLEGWLSRLINEGRNFVAVKNQRVVGHSVYMPAAAAEPELAVFVHQEFQRQGIGTKLCQNVVKTAAAVGRDGLVLEVQPTNRTALHIYKRIGFKRVDHSSTDTDIKQRLRPFQMRLSFSSNDPEMETHTVQLRR